MPTKTHCPECGGAMRSPNHLCHPNSIKKMQARRAALAQLEKREG